MVIEEAANDVMANDCAHGPPNGTAAGGPCFLCVADVMEREVMHAAWLVASHFNAAMDDAEGACFDQRRKLKIIDEALGVTAQDRARVASAADPAMPK